MGYIVNFGHSPIEVFLFFSRMNLEISNNTVGLTLVFSRMNLEISNNIVGLTLKINLNSFF